jgi:hypothetical protein
MQLSLYFLFYGPREWSAARCTVLLMSSCTCTTGCDFMHCQTNLTFYKIVCCIFLLLRTLKGLAHQIKKICYAVKIKSVFLYTRKCFYVFILPC